MISAFKKILSHLNGNNTIIIKDRVRSRTLCKKLHILQQSCGYLLFLHALVILRYAVVDKIEDIVNMPESIAFMYMTFRVYRLCVQTLNYINYEDHDKSTKNPQEIIIKSMYYIDSDNRDSIIRFLLDGFDPGAQLEGGISMLKYAIMRGKEKIVSDILRYSKYDIVDDDVIQFTSECKMPRILKMLEQKTKKLNLKPTNCLKNVDEVSQVNDNQHMQA